MVGSDLLAKELVAHGVEVVFVFTGGAISSIIDSVKNIGIKIIPYDHELDAVYAAEGYVRSAIKPTAILVTSGPGATNTITGIAGSWFDSVPILVISGQVKSFEKTDFKLCLQRGFQEIDFIKSISQFSKYAVTIDASEEILPKTRKAFREMLNGRPGPAILDVTMDAQMTEIQNINNENYKYPDFRGLLNSGLHHHDNISQDNSNIKTLVEKIRIAKNPVILFGGGVQWLPNDLFRRAIEALGVKCVSTYPGVNAMPLNHNLFYGFIGSFGHPEANKIILDASDIFILGARLPHRSIPAYSQELKSKFLKIKKFVLSNEIKEFTNHPIGSLEQVYYGSLYNFSKYVCDQAITSKKIEKTVKLNIPKSMFVSPLSDKRTGIYTVSNLIAALNDNIPTRSHIYVDTGQNSVALCLGLTRDREQKLFSSWANSPMGYSLPAALGSAETNKVEKSVCIIGDGGIRTALSSFPNLRKLRGKIKLIIWDNSGYQTIVDHIEKMLGGRKVAVTNDSGLANFSLVNVLRAFDLKVFEATGVLSSDMKSFFEEDYDALIVKIDSSIRMIPNSPLQSLE